MKNKLLVIENEISDFTKVKNIFDDSFEVFPINHNDIDYYSNIDIIEKIEEAIEKIDISAIIIDISLIGDNDTNGLVIIDTLRKKDDCKYKVIPIFCYSRHGQDKNIISEAFKKGATNIFAKGGINKPDSDQIIFLKQSLIALAFIYTDICEKFAPDIKEVNKQLSNINEKLGSIDNTTKTNLNLILQLSSYQNISNILEIDDNNRSQIEEIIGTEGLDNLLKNKWNFSDKKENEDLIEEVANIFSGIPGLSPFSSILKVILMFSKSLK